MHDPEFARQLAALQYSITKVRRALVSGHRGGPKKAPTEGEALQSTLEALEAAEAELLQQQEALAESHYLLEAERQRYHELFNCAPDGYLVTDAGGFIQEANRAAAALLHRRQDHLVGKPLVLFIALADRRALREWLLRLSQQPSPEHACEVCLQPHPELAVPVELRVTVARDAQGKVSGLRWLLHDLTARKQAEEALRRAKEAAEAADRTKSDFLATISHELRTPLHVIIGYADLLAEGNFGPLTPEQCASLGRIQRNARDLHELITAVLDVNRLEAGRVHVERTEVGVAELLAELKAETQGLCDQAGLACVWRVAEPLPILSTDPGKLKVVLKNLIHNAVKFTKAGHIIIEASASRQGIEISVSDTGIGIPEDSLTVIFEPFHQVNGAATRQHGGVGLGLRIVKQLLQLLGGTVTVESEVGQGSTFRVWVPRERPVSAPLSSQAGR